VSQTFEWPGRLGLRKAIANHDVTLAQLGLERFKLALAARVRGQAHALATANEKARVAREVADRYRALREVLVQRDPAGVTPQLELRILEATEVSLRRRAMEADLAASDARLALNQLLGRPSDGPLDVTTTDMPMPSAPRLDDLLSAAQTNNFDLRLRAVELEQQGFRVSLAKNERWSSFTVGPQFSEENAGEQDRILGLGISFPLPLWRNNASNAEAMKARQVQAEMLLNTAAMRQSHSHFHVRQLSVSLGAFQLAHFWDAPLGNVRRICRCAEAVPNGKTHFPRDIGGESKPSPHLYRTGGAFSPKPQLERGTGHSRRLGG
jgi:cobalt-zinc-cadmium efflux system outer membrane protein